MGAGLLHLRRHHGGRPAEAAVRPLLHQEPLPGARHLHHLRDGQDRNPTKGRLIVPATVAASRGTRANGRLNAMTVDVEDYFHVSVFDGVVPRTSWNSMESRVVANTERL